MNNINICGRLTANPELKTTQNGISVCAYNLAVKRPKVKDTTDFLTCVSWRQGAEYLAKYGRKGDMVAVSGVLTTRSWQDKNGNNRISHEIVADTVEILSSASNTANNEQETSNQNGVGFATPAALQGGFEVITSDEEIPF
jgi:single-strand DNA-binding protein